VPPFTSLQIFFGATRCVLPGPKIACLSYAWLQSCMQRFLASTLVLFFDAFYCLHFSFAAALLKTLEGHPDLILTTIQQRFWPTMIANYAVW
jgi:hypothetical protein